MDGYRYSVSRIVNDKPAPKLTTYCNSIAGCRRTLRDFRHAHPKCHYTAFVDGVEFDPFDAHYDVTTADDVRPPRMWAGGVDGVDSETLAAEEKRHRLANGLD